MIPSGMVEGGDLTDGEALKSAAYEEYVAWLQDEWAKVKPVSDVSIKPTPYGAWPATGTSVQEGGSCSINGRRGTWQQGEDGLLYCIPVDENISNTSNEDARPRFMDAATAQKIKDEAWREMVDDLTNAWRRP
jgi:hypothetical protein